MKRLRLVVLVSGRGTNLRSLLDASSAGEMLADVALVLSNRPDAPALALATERGVEARAIPSAGLAREAHEALLCDAIDAHASDYIVLAGYMRIFTPAFIRRYAHRILNIHPALLPAFPGLDAQAQAHAGGVRIAGCTVHFVTEDVDAGPILMQAAVALPVLATPEMVRERILEAEHRIYPASIHLLATGRARLEAGRVVYRDVAAPSPTVLVSPEVEP